MQILLSLLQVGTLTLTGKRQTYRTSPDFEGSAMPLTLSPCGKGTEWEGRGLVESKVSQYADVEPSCIVRAVAYFLEPAVWSVCLSLVCSG